MTDAREAPTPPRLRWATETEHEIKQAFLVDADGTMRVADTRLYIAGQVKAYNMRPDLATRPAVIAEPTDLQAVAEDIYLAVCGPPVELRTHHQDVSHSKDIAAILAVLERHL